jgi:hypothetical protein
MLSTPALVRVSDMNTSPRLSRSPTQYVMISRKPRPASPARCCTWMSMDLKRLAALRRSAGPRPARPRGSPARGHAHVAGVGRDAVRDVEADPAHAVHMRLGPGMAGVLVDAVLHHQVARDIARGVAHGARAATKMCAWSWQTPAAVLERLLGGGIGIGGARRVGHLRDDPRRQRVQPRESLHLLAQPLQQAAHVRPARVRSVGGGKPERREAAVLAQHAMQVSPSRPRPRNGRRSVALRIEGDERHAVLVVVVELRLLLPAVDLTCPRLDPRPDSPGCRDLSVAESQRARHPPSRIRKSAMPEGLADLAR